jgi:hypothetical protein
MDLREIQRLHAQFSPDTVTIDLPRQIAALPGPSSEPRNPSDSVGQRWSKAGPLFKRCTISIVAAAVLGSAGVGAAVLYRSLQPNNVPGPVSDVRGERVPAQVSSSQKVPSKLREIDAAEPTPVSEAPVLSASDLAGTMPRGLTADQFRHNLGSHAAPAQPSQSPGSSEEQLAMVSPIRRPSERTPQPAAIGSAAAIAQAAPKVPSAVIVTPARDEAGQPAHQVVVAPPASESPAAPATTKDAAPAVSAAPVAAASSQTPQAARAVHHHAVKSHEPQLDQDASSSSDRPKPTPSTAKAAPTEVQMF